MSEDFRAIYLRDVVRTFRNYKSLGEGALAQVADADLHTLVDPDSNSIAIIVKHLAGNLRSRDGIRTTVTNDLPIVLAPLIAEHRLRDDHTLRF